MKGSKPIELSWIFVALVGLPGGYLITQALFLIAWVSKYEDVASPLVNALAGMFPLSFGILLLVGFVSLPVAVLAARRVGGSRTIFLLAASLGPILVAGLIWLVVLAPPHLIGQGYHPLQLWRPPPYYSAVLADLGVLLVGGGLMGACYLLALKIERLLSRAER